MTFRAQEIPFTPENLHALRRGGALLGPPIPVQQVTQHQALGEAHVDIDALERQRRRRIVEYGEETSLERFMRIGQAVGLVLAVAFVASVTVMLAVLSIRVSDAFDNLGGDSLGEKMDQVLDYGLASAKNAHAASANVLSVTQYAQNTAAMAAPQLEHAVNDTSALVEDLRSWSFHPSLAISPGHATAAG
tara:strand:- start:135 stop:704 length:570 start_codon:yes stop_codon:yes gene_type:complete